MLAGLAQRDKETRRNARVAAIIYPTRITILATPRVPRHPAGVLIVEPNGSS